MRRLPVILGVLTVGVLLAWGIDLMGLRSEMNEVLMESEAAGVLPESILDVVERLEGERAETFAVQHLLKRRASQSRSLVWHVRQASWLAGRGLVVSEEELARTFLHSLPYEKGEGIQSASAYYFSKAPGDLSTRELVQLLVVSRAPQRNSPTLAPERHQELVEEALQRLRASP